MTSRMTRITVETENRTIQLAAAVRTQRGNWSSTYVRRSPRCRACSSNGRTCTRDQRTKRTKQRGVQAKNDARVNGERRDDGEGAGEHEPCHGEHEKPTRDRDVELHATSSHGT